MIRDDRRRTAEPIGEDEASRIAVEALAFLARDPSLARRFLQLSGLEADGLRAAAADPAFLAGLLDFFLGHEPTLKAFTDETGVRPETVGRARAALAAPYGDTPS